MVEVTDWTKTDGNNDDLHFEEQMDRSAVNDDARAIMGELRRFFEDAEWLNLCNENDSSFTFATSAPTIFLVVDDSGTDASSKFPVGRWVKLTGTGGTSPIYGQVVTAVYGAPNTTVTLTNIVDTSFVATTITITVITNVECYWNALVREAAFHEVGTTLAQTPQQIPTIDMLGDGVTKDEGHGNGLNGGQLDGREGTEFQLSGLHSSNAIINGAMNVWQRGTGFNSTTLANTDFTADRWYVLEEAANSVEINRAAFPSFAPQGFQYSLGMTAKDTTSKFGIMQIITQQDSRSIIDNGAASLTYYVRLPTTATIRAVRAAVITWDTGGAVDLVATSRDPILAWGAEAGVGVDNLTVNGAGPPYWTIRNTPSADEHLPDPNWARVSIENVTIPATTVNLAVFFWIEDKTHGIGDTFHISGVQLEAGAAASSYQHRMFGDDYALCLAHFQKTYGYETQPGTATQAGMIWNPNTPSVDITPANAIVSWRFYSSMFATPTVTMYNPDDGVEGQCGGTSSEAADAINVGSGGATLRMTTADPSSGDDVTHHATAEAELGT